MKKSFLFIILLTLIIMITLIVFPTPESSLSTENSYTIEQLQDYIVSTAISYYYNNKYTDYEGYWADESKSEYSTTYNISPEMISRSRYMTTQCDAFVSTCYIYSLGYDFSNYNKILSKYNYTSYVTNMGKRVYATDSTQIYKNAYKYFNKIFSVNYSNKIAKSTKNDPSVILTYQKGVISTIEGVTDTSKNVTELLSGTNGQKILNTITSKLQPGDIILNDGHAMLWIGDAFEKEGGAIHSTGSTLKMTRDTNGKITTFKNGYDAFDVRYTSAKNIFKTGIEYHGSKENDIITILRPLNSICTINNGKCTLNSNYASVLSNAITRSKLKHLRVEQYLYDKTGDRTLSADSSSVNVGDEIRYFVNLTNKSKFYFCSSGSKTKETDCINTGFCSNATITNKTDCEKNGYTWTSNTWKYINKSIDYNNITITSKIPDNTQFVKCDKNCKYENGYVTWTNVSIPASSSSEVKYNYTVKVTNSNSIKYDGMKITYDKSSLQMGSFTTFVNSTINGLYGKEFKNIINKDIENNTTCSSSIDYMLKTYENFLNIKNDTSKPIYTQINTDLSKLITTDNIVKGIFNEVNFENKTSYTKKTKDEVNKLSGNYKTINQMLVPYFYGGYRYNKVYHDNNMDYFYKVKPLWSTRINFNIGDVIVTLKKNNDTFTINNVMMYSGIQDNVPTYVFCENNKIIKHGIREVDSSNPKSQFYTKWYPNTLLLYELYSSDLYVVLRPSMHYALKYRNVTPPQEKPTTPEVEKPIEKPTTPEIEKPVENPITPEVEKPTIPETEKPVEKPTTPEIQPEETPEIQPEETPEISTPEENITEEKIPTSEDNLITEEQKNNKILIYILSTIGVIGLLFIMFKFIFKRKINNLLNE